WEGAREGHEPAVMREREISGAALAADPERGDPPVAMDGEILALHGETARERRDGEPPDRIAPHRELRKPRDGLRDGGRPIPRRPRDRMHVICARDQVDAKPAGAHRDAGPRLVLEPHDEAP